ncbi:uncharacterized protein FIBRA_07427 [Fibroporia radiculosa]|uniref:Uncharacterized protein n=1 Tax=Fibroporia radiculosa TaxID=599839 RepID=J4I0N7_9APHY|nr:uncharacterized protein FIBRA_07427 [Fibroporia radiculosa]CCM05217.1 predicted protein [Fibroporia radiculosa]
MRDESDESAALVRIITALGGPELSPQELDWAISLPAGQAIVQWLTLQTTNISKEEDVNIMDIQTRASLHQIALHAEEAKDMNMIIDAPRATAEHSNTLTATPLGYIGVHTLHSQMVRNESEAQLLEDEIRLLKHRFKGIKMASKQLNRSIEALQRSRGSTDETLRRQQELLEESSIHADSLIARSNSIAGKLLNGAIIPTLVKDDSRPSILNLRKRLADLSTRRTELVKIAQERNEQIVQAHGSLPNVLEIEHETTRLQVHLRKLSSNIHGLSSSQAAAGSYCTEMDKICKELGAVEDSQSKRAILERIAGEVDTKCDKDHVDVNEIDVISELNRAWKLDQLALLSAREMMADEMNLHLKQQSFYPLEELQSTLLKSSSHVFETEALVSALTEELEEVADDAESAKRSKLLHPDPGVFSEKEAGLVDLLKSMQHLRPPDAPPLVLLNEEDLKNEIDIISRQSRAASRKEMQWASELSQQILSLTNHHAPLVAALYANSPVNTSPPFIPPRDEQVLEEQAHQTADELNVAVAKCQKEPVSDRDKQKLNAFIDKWTKDR